MCLILYLDPGILVQHAQSNKDLLVILDDLLVLRKLDLIKTTAPNNGFNLNFATIANFKIWLYGYAADTHVSTHTFCAKDTGHN